MITLPSALRAPGFQTYLGAQIRIGQRTEGMLSCFRFSDRGFGVDEIALVTALAEQMGMMLETDRLRQDAQAMAVLQELSLIHIYGAAAIVLASEPVAQALRNGLRPVRLAASAVATDSLAVHDRRDPTWLEAAWISSRKAYDQARIEPANVDLFELHDAFTIMGALSLEACGFAERGKGCLLYTSSCCISR